MLTEKTGRKNGNAPFWARVLQPPRLMIRLEK